jgi:hypothetical protein
MPKHPYYLEANYVPVGARRSGGGEINAPEQKKRAELTALESSGRNIRMEKGYLP